MGGGGGGVESLTYHKEYHQSMFGILLLKIGHGIKLLQLSDLI